MSINPSNDYDKICKVFKSFDDARRSFFKKNSSIDEVLLNKLKTLVDKHLLSHSGNLAVENILEDLTSLKGKKLKDLTKDQDLAQISHALIGQQKHLKPEKGFDVFKSLSDNLFLITCDHANNNKTLQELFFPYIDQASKLLSSRDAKKVLAEVKAELQKHAQIKIQDVKPGTALFNEISQILKKHLVIIEDQGFVSIGSSDDLQVDLSDLKWESKEQILQSHTLLRSTLLSSFKKDGAKASKEGYCGDPDNLQLTNVGEREILLKFNENFETDQFFKEMDSVSDGIEINGASYPSLEIFDGDHVRGVRRSHLKIRFGEDEGLESFSIKDQDSLKNFILEASRFTSFNPSTNDHKMLFLALLNCTTQTNGNLFFKYTKGMSFYLRAKFFEIFSSNYKEDLQESIQFKKGPGSSFIVTFRISESTILNKFPEQTPAIVASVEGSYKISVENNAVSLSDITVTGNVLIPE